MADGVPTRDTPVCHVLGSTNTARPDVEDSSSCPPSDVASVTVNTPSKSCSTSGSLTRMPGNEALTPATTVDGVGRTTDGGSLTPKLTCVNGRALTSTTPGAEGNPANSPATSANSTTAAFHVRLWRCSKAPLGRERPMTVGRSTGLYGPTHGKLEGKATRITPPQRGITAPWDTQDASSTPGLSQAKVVLARHSGAGEATRSGPQPPSLAHANPYRQPGRSAPKNGCACGLGGRVAQVVAVSFAQLSSRGAQQTHQSEPAKRQCNKIRTWQRTCVM